MKVIPETPNKKNITSKPSTSQTQKDVGFVHMSKKKKLTVSTICIK